MKLLFRQRMFSWFDSYDIYDEAGNTAFSVKGKPAWGHKLEIYDRYGKHLGTVREELITLLPRFALYVNDRCIGKIKKEFTFLKQVYTIDYNGWKINGDIMGWNYQVMDNFGNAVIHVSKQHFRLTDTYIIDIEDNKDTLTSLMIVLAIDAANCSSKS